MLDLFQPPKVVPTAARTVRLLVDDPEPKSGRAFVGPPRPHKPYKRSSEQHKAKYQRYLDKHGREQVLADQRRRYAENKHSVLAQKRERYATDPTFRQRQLDAAVAQRARKKAARDAAVSNPLTVVIVRSEAASGAMLGNVDA